MPSASPVIALVAGEASGDQLGADLLRHFRTLYPRASFVGIGGRRMQAEGMDAWWDAEELAVMGLFEVVSHFPRLLRLRRQLRRRLLALQPDAFVGIDAPDFNLGLEIPLRRAGIRTIHYVSPTVWAWREGRVRKIARAADLVLCLFPFEPDFYAGHRVAARYVGHPLADQIALDNDPQEARAALGLEPGAEFVALLPGSRASEVNRLAGPMLEAARILSDSRPELQFVAAMASKHADHIFEQAARGPGGPPVTRILHRPREVIAAADVVMCASGTATLETMLVNRPLVMTYQVPAATYRLANMFRATGLRHYSLPNILAGEPLVPELIQRQANGPALAAAVAHWFEDHAARQTLSKRFRELHEQLRCGAGGKAAAAVAGILQGTKDRSDALE